MENNQNDKRNQHADSKSNQAEINRKEFNPFNPLANNSKEKTTPQIIQQNNGLTTTPDKTITNVKQTPNSEKEETRTTKK